eukprot:12998758-Ditylum_brightwellii.AAC.1
MQVNKVTEEDVPPSPMLKRSMDLGEMNIPNVRTFQSTDRHTDVSPENLSKQWYISVNQATKTLRKTTQKYLRSAILPLARRYRLD